MPEYAPPIIGSVHILQSCVALKIHGIFNVTHLVFHSLYSVLYTLNFGLFNFAVTHLVFHSLYSVLYTLNFGLFNFAVTHLVFHSFYSVLFTLNLGLPGFYGFWQ